MPQDDWAYRSQVFKEGVENRRDRYSERRDVAWRSLPDATIGRFQQVQSHNAEMMQASQNLALSELTRKQALEELEMAQRLNGADMISLQKRQATAQVEFEELRLKNEAKKFKRDDLGAMVDYSRLRTDVTAAGFRVSYDRDGKFDVLPETDQEAVKKARGLQDQERRSKYGYREESLIAQLKRDAKNTRIAIDKTFDPNLKASLQAELADTERRIQEHTGISYEASNGNGPPRGVGAPGNGSPGMPSMDPDHEAPGPTNEEKRMQVVMSVAQAARAAPDWKESDFWSRFPDDQPSKVDNMNTRDRMSMGLGLMADWLQKYKNVDYEMGYQEAFEAAKTKPATMGMVLSFAGYGMEEIGTMLPVLFPDLSEKAVPVVLKNIAADRARLSGAK